MSLHPHNIAQKTEVMVEHFRTSPATRSAGGPRRWSCTSRRLHAVRYKQAFDKYIDEKGYTDIRTLVAFSGTVEDPDVPGVSFTEVGHEAVASARRSYRSDSRRTNTTCCSWRRSIRPASTSRSLHTMYVDKRLDGIQAVQTLSRLNRTCPGKEDTFVLDFVNEPEEILRRSSPTTNRPPSANGPTRSSSTSFRPSSRRSTTTMRRRSKASARCSSSRSATDRRRTMPQMNACLDPAVSRFATADEDAGRNSAKAAGTFRNLYAFLSQVIPFQDTDLEKLYSYIRFLSPSCPRGQPGPRLRLR